MSSSCNLTPPLNFEQRPMQYSEHSVACSSSLRNISVLRGVRSKSLHSAVPDIEFNSLCIISRNFSRTVSRLRPIYAFHLTVDNWRLFVSATRKNAYILYIISELGITGTSVLAEPWIIFKIWHFLQLSCLSCGLWQRRFRGLSIIRARAAHLGFWGCVEVLMNRAQYS